MPQKNNDGVIEQVREFFDTELTNHEVYEKFMSGHQIGDHTPDNELDVDLTVYWSLKSTVGYTYPNTIRTWINRRFFSRYTAAEVCGNIAHEYCHKLGFEHDFYLTPMRSFSVPYGIGKIIEQIANIYVESGYNMEKLGYFPTFIDEFIGMQKELLGLAIDKEIINGVTL